MSEFEYLARMAVGQYLPVASDLQRLHPVAKLIGFTCLILAATLSVQLSGLMIALTFALLLVLLGRIPLGYALRGLLTPMPFILLLALLQLLLVSYASTQPAYFSWGIITITSSGVLAAIRLCLRFFGLVLLISLAGMCMSSLEWLHALEKIMRPLSFLGMRTEAAVMVVQVMLRFIPTLLVNAEKIAKSQAARGAVWGDPKGGILKRARQLLPLILPLFSVSLRQADNLVNAMLARAYGNTVQRGSLQEYTFVWKDALFLTLCAFTAGFSLFPPVVFWS